MSAGHAVVTHHDSMLEFPKKKTQQSLLLHPNSLLCLLLRIVSVAGPGGSGHMAQFFRGNLAGLMIHSGKMENKKVIDCLYTCKEGLDVQLPEEVATSIKVSSRPAPSLW